MDETSAEDKDNYTVTDKDGNNVRISSADLTDKDEVTLTLSKDLEDGDSYKVAIEDVEDKAGNKVADVSKTFQAKETNSVSDVKATYYDAGSSSQKLIIDFDRKMLADGSRYAINNLENYDLTDGTTTINLSDYDDVDIKVVEDAHKVEIKLPGSDAATNDDRFDFSNGTFNLTINKVKDTNENISDILTKTIVANANNIGLDSDNDKPMAVDQETIKLVFDEELTFDKNDIQIKYGTFAGDVFTPDSADAIITPASTNITRENGKTIVTYTLKEEDQLSYNGQYKGHDVAVTTKATVESKNTYGDTITPNQTWKLKDEIAPALAKLEETAGGDPTSTVKYDVPMDDRSDFEDAVKIVAFDSTTKTATIQLVFQENLTNANINEYTFKTDDSDVDVVSATLIAPNTIQVVVDTDDNSTDYSSVDDFIGLGITTGSNEVFDTAADANKAVVNAEVEIKDQTAIDAAQQAVADAQKVAAAKTAIAGGTYTNLEVADTNDAAQKLAAVQAVVDGLKGDTTATVTADGANFSVAISLNAANDTASITTATFVQSDAGKVAEAKATIQGLGIAWNTDLATTITDATTAIGGATLPAGVTATAAEGTDANAGKVVITITSGAVTDSTIVIAQP
ncbi:hypothetical protein [Clostridium brassicae]|uniref:SbsA Ig-like domain-containing protein n=1 Tax=Clostridium brassicae TaxID=2999072 RepID=A0ABT4DE06_9CLOT|nr:hypothetical protein [Clostridium brassicae]MCY6959356.1 hypothetical protein [Clostridium brassicae]